MLIDIYYDLVCPWCYIGKKRMERALGERPSLRPSFRWMPFQLNPGMPRRGMDRRAYLSMKFGGEERAVQIYAVIAETARRDGLDIDLAAIERTPNTLDAHRFVRYAAGKDLEASEVVDRLFDAYFREGADIGDTGILAATGEAMGLDRGAILDHLASEEDVNGVQKADAAARRLGIQAVPCFVFERRYALSGAQEPKAFGPMFDMADTIGIDQMAASRSSSPG